MQNSPIEFIQKLCRECGPRLAGSEGERKCGDIIYEEMLQFCDEVEKEHFRSHPRGFLDYIWFTAGFYLAGVLLYLIGQPVLAGILMLAAFFIFLFQQCLHYEIIDFVFPEVEEFHVVGKIKPKSRAEKLAIISAHYDSPYEFPLLGRLKKKSFLIIGPAIAITLLTMFLSFAEGAANISLAFIQKPLMLIGSALLLLIAFTLRSSYVTLGANDDLAAIAAVLEAGRQLSRERPEKTEVWVVAFAGEEHMRGSKRFVQRHYDELKSRNAIMLALECPSADYFLIATEEKMYFAKHSPLAVEYAKKAAEKIDFDVRVAPLPFAGSDAANFSRKGLHAVSIFGHSAKDDAPYYWHTKQDIPENLREEPIMKASQLVKNFVYAIDSTE
ncbi:MULTISPECIES: M28 family metallopeptidase [Archaeoglobus]|jgi:Zn-dependent M28 family amino/carboxypeptidase|uniref:Aminopeptidase, putative n=3 Tax=Archaeoglobus fulgidus TaxID=2234 RepID=O29677_ARCFU|nr:MULTISPECIES: M28 family metallopeptidase [Archaeoglobus]AAB90663.1 aminopeptidase, putative [Archaeoglobus fulgidus DSM 4304]AIG97455.1 putative aminopeptidase [Archaeoglobus fulgidus DSM 8774]KUJ93087.1 MAG: Aminopeptidase, putative [Archaeoglobus fulgidus]KUK06826.1 MAG: Aminopeptidase, putative [Archaeoglobus fulgidus]MDI3498033.1 hypothetical protein [Archaeoglobus sp.]